MFAYELDTFKISHSYDSRTALKLTKSRTPKTTPHQENF